MGASGGGLGRPRRCEGASGQWEDLGISESVISTANVFQTRNMLKDVVCEK